MPCRAIPLSAGLFFHVCNRSAKKTRLFTSADDYALLERMMFANLRCFPIALYAYCVMPTHWHFLVQPQSNDALPRYMHRVTWRHARVWRDARDSRGEGVVYQGRFRAVPIQSETQFLRVSRYIERNPLRAGLVHRAEQWKWSSLWRWHTGEGVDWLADWPVARPETWIEDVNLPQNEAEESAIRTTLRTGEPLGTSDWCRQTRARLGMAERGRPGRPRKVAVLNK